MYLDRINSHEHYFLILGVEGDLKYEVNTRKKCKLKIPLSCTFTFRTLDGSLSFDVVPNNVSTCFGMLNRIPPFNIHDKYYEFLTKCIG